MDNNRLLSNILSGRGGMEVGGKRVLFGRILGAAQEGGRIAGLEVPDPPRGLSWIASKDIPGPPRMGIGGVSVPILAGARILWRGQPILAAAGPDLEAVDDWLSRVEPDIRKDKKDEDPKDGEFVRAKGDPEGAMSSVFQIIEDSFAVPPRRLSADPRGTLCLRDGRSYVLHCATVWPAAVRRAVSRVLGIDAAAAEVRPYSSGPGMKQHGRIWHPAVHSAIAALLAWKAKRSVRLTSVSHGNRPLEATMPGAEFRLRGGLDASGRLVALDAEITVEAGALFPWEKEVIDRIALGMIGLAPIAHYRIRGRIRRTGQPPATFGPAAGLELGVLAGELFTSWVAENNLESPARRRLETLPGDGETMGPGIVRPKDFPVSALLKSAMKRSDYERKFASCDQVRLARHRLEIRPEEFRGMGLSCAGFGNGFMRSAKELGSASLSITLDKNGKLRIDAPTIHEGPLSSAWRGIARRILGIEEESIQLGGKLPSGERLSGPAILGRRISVYTRLLETACTDLSKRWFRSPLPITASRTRRRGGAAPWNPREFEGSPFETYSWGAGAAEATLSSRTSEVTSVRLWLAIDGGTLLTPQSARVAVENSAEEALIWCLGRLTPRVIPHIDIEFVGGHSRRPPRDVSTLPWLLVPAAVVQALRQASGSQIDRIPVTPDRLFSGGRSS